MTLTAALEEHVVALERDALVLRKLLEAAEELGEERLRTLLGPVLNGNGNGNGNGHNVHDAEPKAVSEPVADDGPRGREAIRFIVSERYGLWTLAELRAEMKRRTWFTSNKGVDVAVTRMCANGEARRVGKGRYEFFDPAREEEPL
jgi:hypothetical protein